MNPNILSRWLSKSYTTYLEYIANNGRRLDPETRSGDWDSEGKIRVSQLASVCPIRLKKEGNRQAHTLKDYAKFEDAVRIAEVITESIRWSSDGRFICSVEHRIVDKPVDTSHPFDPVNKSILLSGTIDLLLTPIGDSTVYFGKKPIPIEIKRTDIRFPTRGQFLQVIGEMLLVDADLGILFSRFDMSKDEFFHIYYIMRENDTFSLYSGLTPAPAEIMSMTLYEYVDRADEFRDILSRDEEWPSPMAEYQFLENWQCCTSRRAEYYSISGIHKGAKKPGTGTVTPRCPFFFNCWKPEVLNHILDYEWVNMPEDFNYDFPGRTSFAVDATFMLIGDKDGA